MLFLYDEIIQLWLLRKLIAESQPVVEQTETDDHVPVILRLVERHFQFIIMIADFTFFTPHRTPGLVKGRSARFSDFKTGHQIRFLVYPFLIFTLRPFKTDSFFRIFPFQFQSQCTGFDDRPVLKAQLIHRSTFRIQTEVHHQIPVRRGQFLCVHPQCATAQSDKGKSLSCFHKFFVVLMY